MIIMCMTTIKNKVRICPFIYIVCLLLFAACSNEDNAGKDIPSATFSIAPERGQIEGEIQFTNASYGGSGNFTYVWDFGDGTTSTEENPKHVYNEKGIFVVSLTITDSSGRSNLYRKTIEITDKVVEKGDLTLLWTSSTHLAKLVSNSAALSPDEKTVYINSNDHILHSYDVTSGIEKWSFDMTDPSWGAQATGGSNMTPSVDTDGTIYIGTGDGSNGKLFAINPDGNKKWITFNDPTTGFWNKGNAANAKMRSVSPAFDDKYVYCGNGGSTGSMIAVDKTTGNRVSYLTNADGTSGPAGGVYAGPVISKQGMMYIMCTNYGMFGVAKATMAKDDNTFSPWAWRAFDSGLNSGCHASMAIDNEGNVYGMIYTSDLTTTIYSVASDGSVRWTTPIENTGKQDQGGVVIGTDGTVYASLKSQGDMPGGIVALSAGGTIKWQYEISESVSSTPVIDKDGHILFGTERGNFYILDANGTDAIAVLDIAGAIANSESAYASEWAATQGKFWSSPVVDADGTIYVAITNTQDESKSLLVALSSKYVKGLPTTGWPMRAKDAQHTATVK